MKISVIGCGYLGAVHAATLASMGHQVTGIDLDPRKIDHLNRGFSPFFEAGLEELLHAGRRNGTLRFTSSYEGIDDAEVHFLCVGTPQSKTGQGADLSHLVAAAGSLAPQLRAGAVVVGKSTVPVGTVDLLGRMLAGTGALLGWNPEFLRQGTAVADSLHPDRLVYGVDGTDGGRVAEVLDAVYAPLLAAGTPRLVVGTRTAELIKSAANAFLSLKLSYVNALSEFCDASGADVQDLSLALGMDARIGGTFLRAGVGFGGGCLPKDLRSLKAQAQELGVDAVEQLMGWVDGANGSARRRTVDAARTLCGGRLGGRRITVLGAAFKPNTDDIRDSPALDIAVQLAAQGANVVVTDPRAINNAWLQYPQLRFEPNTRSALDGAELVLLLTEWADYVALDPVEAAAVVARPVMLDGRNALDAALWRTAGWEYHGIGRGADGAAAAGAGAHTTSGTAAAVRSAAV
ncbi:UDP-glucose dehydrogenase family protein [Arthrobacter sp. 35W]|uniref:UDP-glucose dehydrogenase family protein n=1 Tax=Arthrobacter sp. 35W TaxID=1132441 RepID=UPI0004113623|nr:UDP-glucose/GDP-mannose dehydrogenase family protein [Arthrobacter sp. 35W]